jgi:hypothetical protein
MPQSPSIHSVLFVAFSIFIEVYDQTTVFYHNYIIIILENFHHPQKEIHPIAAPPSPVQK